MIYFEIVALSFLSVAFCLVGYMLVSLWRLKKRRSKYRKWKNIADQLVRDAILHDGPETNIVLFTINHRAEVLLNNPRFRKIVTKEILLAKKNVSGHASKHLQSLYFQLHLDKYAVRNLASKEWHIKAKAIQELGIMNLRVYLNKVYKYTNDKNELIRVEAQIAVIRMIGFEGLRFLDVVSTQINDWQQIKLLNELSYLQARYFNGIEKWLISENDSVVVFALKLVANFHRYELYQQVEECLNHKLEKVRYHAVKAFEKIYTADTSKKMLEIYPFETLKNRKVILRTLQQIGTEDDIPVIISFLADEELEEKRDIIRTVANISQSGLTQLRLLPETKDVPLSLIIKQIEGELVV